MRDPLRSVGAALALLAWAAIGFLLVVVLLGCDPSPATVPAPSPAPSIHTPGGTT